MLNDCGVVIEYLIGERLGAPRGWDSFYRQQVLCRAGNPMQRTAVVTSMDFLFGGASLFQGNFRRQPREGIELGSKLFAAVQIALRQLHGRNLLGLNFSGEFADS